MMERWMPPIALSPQEKLLMKRLTRVRKLFGFLREHRHELFDDSFQAQLEGMCCRARWLMGDRASWLMGIRLSGALSAAPMMARRDNAPASRGGLARAS